MVLNTEWRPLAAGLLRIGLIIVLGHLSIRIGSAFINRVWGGYGSKVKDPRRVKTMAALLRSLLRYSVDFIAFVTILEVLDIKTGSVLAGAGIVGLAVGFGAQNFVKDLIAGFFIIYEDQFAVGEYVSVAGVTGVVEDVGLRVTKVRAPSGELHIIPNGVIDRSTNMSRGTMLALVDIPVSAEEPIGRVSAVLAQVASEIAKSDPQIKEGPDLLGPVEISEKGVTFRIIARTEPLAQWGVERKIRAAVKEAFEKEGVKLPFILLPSKE